jgi:tRNA pseudouridine38-40 synthase
MTRHIRLVVEYDGSELHGWQRQHGAPTVQQHLEDALAKLLQHETPIVGASRTDAGVHARGQVASFRTERDIPLHGVRRGLNSMLPDTIAVRDAIEVPDDFHPRFSATGKHYRYTILMARDRSPRWRNRAWHHPDKLDVAAMHDAARALIGEHDFAAFRAAGCTAKTTMRRVDSITFTRLHPGVLEVDIRGNAFLRQMVRIMVGTLTEVGTGKRQPGQLPEILAGRDRTKAGTTAPAHGLELIEVRYDGTRATSVSSRGDLR